VAYVYRLYFISQFEAKLSDFVTLIQEYVSNNMSEYDPKVVEVVSIAVGACVITHGTSCYYLYTK
jgi:hypothetical protein